MSKQRIRLTVTINALVDETTVRAHALGAVAADVAGHEIPQDDRHLFASLVSGSLEDSVKFLAFSKGELLGRVVGAVPSMELAGAGEGDPVSVTVEVLPAYEVLPA